MTEERGTRVEFSRRDVDWITDKAPASESDRYKGERPKNRPREAGSATTKKCPI